MITRIVHISDLHYPSRDDTVARLLKAEIVRQAPDVLVITGDLVNHPIAGYSKARRWIRDLLQAFPADRRPRTLVLEGNHDVGFWGLVGLGWWRVIFRFWFREFQQPDVWFLPESQLCFLKIDTNPRLLRLSAEGVVSWWRIRRLRRRLLRHPQAEQIQSAAKVFLIHHHVLPVPHQGGDFLLAMKKAHELLRFLAEQKVDLLLHGHKHRATWSHLRIGGSSTDTHFIEVVGAGAAMKSTDYDPRGHNFNLITIGGNGVRHVRQFFKRPQDPAFLETASSAGETALETLVQRGFQSSYRVKEIRWDVLVTDEGDARNTYSLDGLFFRRRQTKYQLELPKSEVEGGRSLPYKLQDFGGGSAWLSPEDSTSLLFRTQPEESAPAHAAMTNLDLNAYSLNQTEAAEKGLPNPKIDYLEYTLLDPVDTLTIAITLPEKFEFKDVILEVLEAGEQSSDLLNEPLSLNYTSGLSFPARNRIQLSLTGPSPHFRYRLQWALPEQVGEASPRDLARRSLLERAHTTGGPQVLWPVLEAAIRILKEEIERQIASVAGLLGEMEASLMVCDRTGPIPVLRIVAFNPRVTKPGFTLPIGLGNAGRAYKKASVTFYDQLETRKHPDADTYVESDGRAHTFLLSAPLLNLECPTLPPLAVLNFGVFSSLEADLLRCLATIEAVASLQEKFLGEPLDILYKIAKLEREE